MTTINKTVRRLTYGTVFDRGTRPVIVSIEAPNLVGFRLKGTRRTYYLTAEIGFGMALRGHMKQIEKEKAEARKKKGRRR